MTWRSLQLNGQPCSQDLVIYDLFADLSVRYVGNDTEFANTLQLDPGSSHLVMCINHPVWLSELLDQVSQELANTCHTFYIGINRYYIKGNDTNLQIDPDSNGSILINLIKNLALHMGYSVTKHGMFDNDCGRHFNFVQPLTWVYGKHHSVI